ncbi:hypothetical protein [Geodermatophilus sp. SYSU D00700]
MVVGSFVPLDESSRVLNYRPVDGPIVMHEGLESALGSWLDLVLDAVHQAGAASTLVVDDLLLALHLAD